MSSSNTQKQAIGFFGLISIVISSQIGAGALSMPAVFAPLGISGLLSWFTIGLLILCLAYIFAQLSIMLPYTGGPHVYIQHAFGKRAGFFSGWLYWLVSWISTAVLLIECMSYLNQILHLNLFFTTFVGFLIWTFFNYINYNGVQQATSIEICLTVVKLLFFGFFITLSIMYFNPTYIPATTFDVSLYQSGLSSAMWCFIGIEAATVPADLIINPKQTMPKALILGTVIVFIVYILSIVGVMGLIPNHELSQTAAPYAIISHRLFGMKTQAFLSFIVFLICAGSLNAWILISGQIAAGLGHDKLLPASFTKLHNGSPYFGILISYIGVSIIWICGSWFSLLKQMTSIIDYTVPAFIIIYILCCLAFIKISSSIIDKIIGFACIGLCVFLIASAHWQVYIMISALLLTGIPIWNHCKQLQ